MDNNRFAEKIINYREEKNLSQKQFGDMLGVSNKTVSKWETGESLPKMKTIVEISHILGISSNELLTGTRYDEANFAPDDNEQKFNSLERENVELRSALHGANKRKKNILTVCVVFCIACLTLVIILLLSLTGGGKSVNTGIKDLGKNATTIQFCSIDYHPASELEQRMISDNTDDYNDTKKARYTDCSGAQSDIVVKCDRYSDYILVRQKGRVYVYVKDGKEFKPGSRNTSTLYFLDRNDYADMQSHSDWWYMNYIYDYDTTTIVWDEGLKYFYTHYNKKERPDNAEQITKKYFDNKSKVVLAEVELNGDYEAVALGEVFSGSKGKLYFYDYNDSQTYVMGGDLFKYE